MGLREFSQNRYPGLSSPLEIFLPSLIVNYPLDSFVGGLPGGQL